MKKFKKNNKVDIKNKLNSKAALLPYSKAEFCFNLISILLMLGTVCYFGGRSIYYYSKQHKKMEQAALTLNGVIVNNNRVTSKGDGLHQDVDGYYFKGNVSNNYVSFANRIFRVIRVNNDESIKLVTDDIVSEFMWGDSENYKESNLHLWLTKVENAPTSGVYLDTLPSGLLANTSYTVDKFEKNKVTSGKEKYEDLVTSLSIKDYSNANGKNSYLNINKYFWLLGESDNNDKLYVSEDGSLLNASLYESYGIRPVITLKANIEISRGSGTKEDPYVVNQGNQTNYVDNYVQFNNDLWKVYYDKDGVLKLAYTAVSANMAYSRNTSLFNPNIRSNVGYYLNSQLYNSLPYKDYFQDFVIYTGEVSSDTSLQYGNIYSQSVPVKMGLLNVFDYINISGDDFYLGTTLSSVGSMAYVYHSYGSLEEVRVTEAKNIIPTISIKKDIIKSGTGTMSDPYKVV